MTNAVLPLALTRRTALAGTAALAGIGLRRARAETINTVIIGANGWLFPVWEKVKEADLATIDRVAPIVVGVVKQLKAAGIEVAITLMPIRARVYPQFLPADTPFAADARGRYAHGRDQLTAAGLLAPDLATLLAGLAAVPASAATAGGNEDFVPVGSDLFFKADSHWATPGSLPTADEMARQIATSLTLPPAPAPGTQLGDPVQTLQEKNDLAELLPAAQQSQYKFESYMLPAVAGVQGDEALITSDAADTVVIGNSFMQPKYGFSAQLSAKLNRPVSLFWKIDRYGPYATLVQYLQSDLFRQQRPKLIVWNMREIHLEHLPDDDDFYGPNAMATTALTSAISAAVG